MRNALTAAIVSALIATSIGGAAVGISRHDQAQDAQIAKLIRHDRAQVAKIKSLEWYRDWTEFRYGKTSETIQQIYAQAFGCLGQNSTPVVIRSDGTLATAAAGETPDARVVMLRDICWPH